MHEERRESDARHAQHFCDRVPLASLEASDVPTYLACICWNTTAVREHHAGTQCYHSNRHTHTHTHTRTNRYTHIAARTCVYAPLSSLVIVIMTELDLPQHKQKRQTALLKKGT